MYARPSKVRFRRTALESGLNWGGGGRPTPDPPGSATVCQLIMYFDHNIYAYNNSLVC